MDIAEKINSGTKLVIKRIENNRVLSFKLTPPCLVFRRLQKLYTSYMQQLVVLKWNEFNQK